MTYSSKEARQKAFEQLHEALNTPERLTKLVTVFDRLLDSESPRIQAFTAGVLIDLLFQPDQKGAIVRNYKPNVDYYEKLALLTQKQEQAEPSEDPD